MDGNDGGDEAGDEEYARATVLEAATIALM